MATKYERMMIYTEGFYSWTHMTLWPSGLAEARAKPKPLYLCYHSAYGYQTSQHGDLI